MTMNHNNIGVVLCQECLCVRPYTDARHMAEERCDCGGEFCGCLYCECGVAILRAGIRSGAALGLTDKGDLAFWCEETGTRQPDGTTGGEHHPTNHVQSVGARISEEASQ